MLKSGDTIGKYKVTKEINIGGFCNSYFVNDSSGSYFMKEYTEPKQSDPVFRDFYNNQCTIIERLNSMGSIAEKYVDHFVENGIYYQVKVKLKGLDLETYISSPREYPQLKELCVILCGVIKNLHSQNIVHQDLKPAQIMLVDDERGKKTKLGYRIVLSDFDWSIPDGKVVQIVGTPYFKSPEHYLNVTPVYQSDIYTLAVMIYSLLTGRKPLDFDDTPGDEELKTRTLKGKIFAPPQKLNSDIDDAVNSVILRCLDIDPKKRPSIDEIQSALIGVIPVPASEPSVAPPKETPKIAPSPSIAPPKGVETGFAKFSIASMGHKMIIYATKELYRLDFKLFFADVTDKSGNPAYKYCDESQSMLTVTKEPDGSFSICALNETKNYFLINSARIGKDKIKILSGDKLELFSTSRGESIASFEIQT